MPAGALSNGTAAVTARCSEHIPSAWRRALDLDLAGDGVFLLTLGLVTTELVGAAEVLVVRVPRKKRDRVTVR